MWIKLGLVIFLAVCLFPENVQSQVNFPDHCSNYEVLDEWDRNIRNGGCGRKYGKECFCDNAVQTNRPQSPKWQQPGYYRFLEPAGTQMAESSQNLDDRCGADAGGWLNGTHPEEYGVETPMTVCFDGAASGTCNYQKEITVTRCSSYYVYKLDTPPCWMSNPPNCALRYCATRPGGSEVLKLEEELKNCKNGLPKQCSPEKVVGLGGYKELDEADRSSSYNGLDTYEDDIGLHFLKTSPSYKGKYWYRVVGLAGTRLLEKEDGYPGLGKCRYCNCGTYYPGVMNAKHADIQLGQTQDVEFRFCFKSDCEKDYTIYGEITNCNGFFVYNLPPVTSCFGRYCSTSKAIP